MSVFRNIIQNTVSIKQSIPQIDLRNDSEYARISHEAEERRLQSYQASKQKNSEVATQKKSNAISPVIMVAGGAVLLIILYKAFK